MSNQGELKSVTVLDILIISESVAIPMNLYRSIWTKFFAAKIVFDKTFQVMFWPCRFDVNGYRFSTSANELEESLFKLLFLLLAFNFFQSFWIFQACSFLFVGVVAQGKSDLTFTSN